MYNPIATYRLQFYKEFTFSNFEKIIPYLRDLGVSTIYASPIFESVPGSTHGYDGLNPNKINPEIGTLEQLEQLSATLQQNKMGWLQDIVPNHMAYHPYNDWLTDMLEKGQQSAYASFFDIDWHNDIYKGQVMSPFLGKPLEDAINSNELKITYNNDQKRIVINYYDASYPISPLSYATVLQHCDNQTAAIRQFSMQINKLANIKDPQAYALLWNEYQEQLASFMQTTTTKSYIQTCIDAVNNDGKLLEELLTQQNFRLCQWQETDQNINYRRFFTINGLICINIQEEQVFNTVHRLAKELTEKNIFHGLRIDHIDGLHNPTKYVEQLRAMAGDNAYIVAEKILGAGEKLPDQWPMQGNTGYDFLAMVNNLFTKKESEKIFDSYYKQLADNNKSIAEQISEKKAYILYERMGGELKNLYHLFINLRLANDKELESVTEEELTSAIGEFLIACPVYRFYGNSYPLAVEEVNALKEIFGKVTANKPKLAKAVSLLETVLLQHTEYEDPVYNNNALRFYQRCMQFTGPLMAKGVEDTLMYTYNRFIGHNEVGDSPAAFGISGDKFHHEMIYRAKHWPYSLNATATHDTKRGEDVRARLNVLTDIADEWIENVEEWRTLNAGLKTDNMPDANDEYFIYQTLAGIYPTNDLYKEHFEERIKEYLQKAIREAKTHSNWAQPNEEYEKAAQDFALSLLDTNHSFIKKFQTFIDSIADHGIINSLSQLTLKFTCPGTPDVFQGCELWDLSLVDPDNRRAVNYTQRAQWLEDIAGSENNNLLKQLWEQRSTGKIKLWLTQQLYLLREKLPDLLSIGSYVPLQITGTYKDNVIAFARRHKDQQCIVAIPLHTAELCYEQQTDFFSFDWKDTVINLPDSTNETLTNILTGSTISAASNISVQELFKLLPITILQ